MNQQQEGYLNGHFGAANRSPNSSRPGYATTVGFPGMGLGQGGSGRQNQRNGGGGGGIDALSQQVSDLSFYGGGDERFNTFNPGASRYDGRSAPSPGAGNAAGNFMMFANSQAWGYNANANYNGSTTATINGAISDPTRMRGGVNRRAPLPTEWGVMGDSGLGAPSSMGRGQLHHYSQGPASISSMGTTNGQMYTVAPPAGAYSVPDLRPHGDDDDGPGLIKTAIVIKNIPFNVRKETLQALMVELNLPQPYAFNYHFDQGVFRGLAFANFAHPEETKVVINAMNGMDVSGRKLRVEYKKMLPEHERERIEREKREKRGQLEEQHRAVPLHHQPSLGSIGNNVVSCLSDAAASSYREHGIDMNKQSTITFYLELFMFRKDPAREIMIFPPDLSPEARRDIHVISHSLGLSHTSVGDGDNRQVVVKKSPSSGGQVNTLAMPTATGATLDTHPRGLSRAATIDFAEQSRAAGPQGAWNHAQTRAGGGLLGVPGSPDGPQGLNGLRGVKSFADLRSYSPSPSPSVTSASNVALAPGSNVTLFGHYTTESNAGAVGAFGSIPIPQQNGASDGLGPLARAAFDAGGSGQISRPRAEGPGAIGSQRPGAGANNGNSSNRAPERQPRGPGVETTGFGSRTRQNGHIQRGSDSSDNAGAPTSSTWSH